MGYLDQEIKAVVGIANQLVGAGTVNGAAFDMKGWLRGGAVVDLGPMDAGATLDVKLQESEDGSSGWSDVAGAAFTQLVDGTHDNTVHIGSFDARRLKRYGRIVAVIAVNTVRLSVAVLLSDPESGPATQTYSTGFHV